MEQFVLVPAFVYGKKSLNTQTATKQGPAKYQVEQNSNNPTDSFQKEVNKNLFAKAGFLVNKNLSCPRVQIAKTHLLNLDRAGIWVILSDFAQQLRRKNADVVDIYTTLPGTARPSPNLVPDQNATAQDKEKELGPFKIWTSEAAKNVHSEWCCLRVCAQISVK